MPSLQVFTLGEHQDDFERYFQLLPRTWRAVQRLPHLQRLYLEGLSIPSHTVDFGFLRLQRLALQECFVDAADLSAILLGTSER